MPGAWTPRWSTGERESALLRETFERTVAGRQCQLFTILGAAGRRQIAAGRGVPRRPRARARSRSADGACRTARGSRSGRSSRSSPRRPAWPTAIRRPRRGARSRGVVAGERRGEQAAERVAQVIGIGEGSAGVDETFWAIRTFLEALARRRPLVVMLDDVHWAEPTLLDLIDHVADWSKDVPIMVIALSRPDLLEARPTWGGGKVNASTVLLEPLTDGDSEALVANLLGSADVSADAKDRIIEAAGGNPFFVEEIVSMLIDDGLLVREGRIVARHRRSVARGAAAHDLRAPGRPAGPAGARGARDDPARVHDRGHVLGRRRRGADDDDDVDGRRAAVAIPRPQGAAAAGAGRRGRGRHLSVPAHPHPRCRLRGDPQTAPVRPARAIRRLAADVGRHTCRGVRGDPRATTSSRRIDT